LKKIILWLVLIVFLTACSSPTPAPTPDTQATIETLSGTMVAATLTAWPSNTPQPTNTSLPTATLAPTFTATPEILGTATPDPALLLPTATAWSGAFSPGDTSDLPVGYVLIVNNTKVKGLIVTLNGTTLTREKNIYYSYSVGNSLLITVLQAHYNYIIQIPNKKIFTGSFTQMTKDKTTIRVELDKVVIAGP
jgi:hypothetical protein